MLLLSSLLRLVLIPPQMPIKTFPDSFEYKWYDLDDMSETNLLEIFDEAHQFICTVTFSSLHLPILFSSSPLFLSAHV